MLWFRQFYFKFMISDKVTLLNSTVLKCINENDEQKIIEAFTETSIKVLDADYGFVWLNSFSSNRLAIKYKSKDLPFEPKAPRKKGRNYRALESKEIDFVSDVKEASDAAYLNKYIKSFVIIPICYRDKIYGNIVICFKEKQEFSTEKKTLCTFIGNSLAQSITIHRLIKSELNARALAERNEAYFRALSENSYEVILLVDKEGWVNYASPSVNKFFGIEPKDITGHKVDDFIYNSRESISEYLNRIKNQPNTSHILEFAYRAKNGADRFLEATGYSMLKNPNVKGIVINMRDITSRKSLESEKATRILLEDEKRKIAFMAEANHELRTPLAIIKGNVDLILREAGRQKRRYADNALHDIDDEVKHLTNILSDFSLLTTSKQEASYRIVKKDVNLSKIITKAIARFKVIAKKKKIRIKKKISKVSIFGDEKYLERLIVNLIKNAINYGKKGGYINIELIKKSNKQVELKVSDNGIGISPDDLPYIFERFYRADKSHSVGDKSTGLGLAICKWIIDAHNGDIKAQSIVDKGTTFTINLPISHIPNL
jgi:PAS domain S-box-containing protein